MPGLSDASLVVSRVERTFQDQRGDEMPAGTNGDDGAPATMSFYHMHADPDPKYPTKNEPMRHAFVLVGDKTFFLCHQIMAFMEGHNYELVLEVSLDGPSAGILRQRSQQGLTHFLANRENEQHTLPEFASGRVIRFVADAWSSLQKTLGPPWARSPDVAGINVKVERVVHYRHMDENPIGWRWQCYTLFGSGDEAHLYHSVLRDPDYDHVATLASDPEWIQPAQLEAGVRVTFPGLPRDPDRTPCENPLPDGSSHTVLFQGIETYRDPMGQDPAKSIPVPRYEIAVKKTWWFSTRIVNFFAETPCPGWRNEIPTPT
jgi:hypothetical protein